MRKILLAVSLLMFCTVGAFAQTGAQVSFGYSHFTSDRNGWDLAGAMNGEHWAGEADLGAYYAKDGNNIYSYMFGPKYRWGTGEVDKSWNPFAHFLLGGARVSSSAFNPSDTSLAFGLGGGTEYKFNDAFGGEAKLDWIHTNLNGGGQGHFRLGAGLVYHFGK